MSVATPEAGPATLPASLLVDSPVRAEIEQFLYFEAELLDDRRFSEWLTLCADDIRYWMPMRLNRLTRDRANENSGPDDLSHFNETRKSLGWRVAQLETNMHWSEAPPSRTRHLVTNVRVAVTDNTDEFAVRSNFLCYRNRLEEDVDIWAGDRSDVLRRVGERAWQLAQRTILLDQNVVLSPNLSVLL